MNRMNDERMWSVCNCHYYFNLFLSSSFRLLYSLLRSHRYDRRFIYGRRSNVRDVRNTSIYRYCLLLSFFFLAFHQKIMAHFFRNT